MRYYFTTLLLLLATIKTFAQIEPVNINFVEAQPIWVHTVVDTTFKSIQGQPYWTQYSSLSHGSIRRKNDDLYILSSSNEPKTLDDYGFVLDKIDVKTGKKLWTHHNTLYNKGIQDFYHQIDFDQSGNIELFGVYDLKKPKSILKSINFLNGNLITTTLAKDSIYKILPNRLYKQFKLSSSIYLSAIEIGEVGGISPNYTYNYGVTLRTIDNQLNYLKNKRVLFDFDALGPFSIDQPSFTEKLNNNTLVSLAYKDRIETFENKGTKIMWIDISNPSDIKLKQIKDFTTLIPGTKYSFVSHKFKSMNNTIFISHRYPNFSIQKNTGYILWLDTIGMIKTFFTVPKYGKHIYELCDMIYANNSFGYVLGIPSVTGKEGGIDILRIEHGIDTLKYISSLTTSIAGSSFGATLKAVYEDGYFILGGVCSQTGQKDKTALKIHCFRATDLGIDFKPIVKVDETTKRTDFEIFPNPTDNSIFIKVNNISNAHVKIFSNFGEILINQKINQNYNEIDLGNISNGVYFIELQDEQGNRIGKIQKMIKI